MAGFRKGGDEAAEAAKSQGGGAAFARVQYLMDSMFENDQIVLRYVTDKQDWIYVDQHMMKTKNKPADWGDSNWPSQMTGVCRYDEAFGGKYSDCYICDGQFTNDWGRVIKPTIRDWAIACIRDEVVATPDMVGSTLPDGREVTAEMVGTRLGFTDRMRKVARPKRDDKGEIIKGADGKAEVEEIEERALVVVNMAPTNYFDSLRAAASIYGTACDRDYVVKRQGEKKDKVYNHIPLDPTGLKPGTEGWKRYTDAIEEQGLDLEAIIADKASDEYYALFFDPSKTPAARGGGSAADGAAKPEVAAAPSNEVDGDRLEAMRNRVKAATTVAVD